MRKIKVLIVDDSPLVHKLIAKALPGDSFEVCGLAKNGREGLELYGDLHPDVVTMDITMPVMDGLTAAQEILARDGRARIIMLTSRGDKESVEKAKALGIDAFIQKPFAPDQLLKTIQRLTLED
ncbi:MAG: response regulator [Bacillota bacterium]